MVAALRRGRIRRRALSFAARLPIFRCRAPQGRFHRRPRRRNTGFVTVRTMGAFVGRASELAELERTLEAVRSGAGRTILIAGEAGMGKTRLATELASRARDAGFEVLLGRSIDLVGTELPFQPFVEALRPVGDPPRPAQTGGSQLQMFDETLAVLTERATSVPVLLVLEDSTGPIRRRSISSSTSPTTSTTARFCCSRPTAPTSPRRPSACGGLPTACGARGRGRARARPARERRAGRARWPPTPTLRCPRD